MAVVLITERPNYLGLSTDTKPTPVAGALFFETDTGVRRTYTGSAWVEIVEVEPWQ